MKRFLIAAAVLGIAAAVAIAQQQQPTFRAGVNLVRVDVIVTDKQGAPVTDLKASDFDVFEDGRPQKIDSFRLIRIASRSQPGDQAPREIRNEDDEAYETSREDIRLVVIFLDDYHVRIDAAMRIRPALHRFIDTQLGPNDLVAVMYPLMPVSALRFTHDRYELGSAIERFEGRKGNYMPRNDAEARYSGAMPAAVEQIRNEVTLSALEGLVIHLGSLREGRKSVILVSEGFPLPWTDMKELQDVADAANRNNASIYALDPRGLTVEDNSYLKDTLYVLANNTDGRAIVGANSYADGLRSVLRDSSAYYLLGYSSDLTAADGKFHEIKVRVKRPGTEVRARKGYWAPTAEAAAKAAASPTPDAPAAVTRALSSITAPTGGRLIRTWMGSSRGEAGKTRVSFVWEPTPGDRSVRPARVSLVVSGANGETYFEGPVPDEGTVSGRVAGRAVFEAPPGKVRLKVTVEDADDEVVDTEVRDFVVPAFTADRVTIGTPVVFSGRTVRELRTLVSDPEAVPTSDRQFSRIERLLIRFDVYAPAPPPAVSMRLLNRNGDAMTSLSPQADAATAGRYALELPLGGIPAGEYLIEITAKGEAGEATELVPIRVTA
jgi:VWFA-related protein